jgi:dTDP-4-dehydrorhamnose reductase
MKLLVIGGSGMLGTDLCAEAASRGLEVFAPSSTELDITNLEHTASIALDPGWFDWCVNCAAYTAVDKAESEREQAVELNTLAPGYLAGACSMAGIKLIHISTDFVFDGSATSPYAENAPTRPLGVYGESKRQGELSVLSGHSNASIVRTSWLYGARGRCFPKTMISAWEAGKALRVISDQTGCPTYTVDLARVLLDMIEKNARPDIYHACGPTVTTWHGFAVDAITAWRDLTGSDRSVEVEPIPTEAYPTPARRPKYSVLSCERLAALGIEPMRPLGEALADFVGKLQIADRT